MLGRWGLLLAFVMWSVSGGCDGCKKKEPPLPDVNALEEASRARQRAEEANKLAEQQALEEQHRADQQRSAAAKADETAKRERTAQEAADQQRTAEKTKGARRDRHSSESPHKVLAAQQEVVATGVVPAPPGHSTLHFRSDAGKMFRLVEAHFVMDGVELPVVIKAGERGKTYLLTSDLSSGSHKVTTQLTYQGAKEGVIDYMKGYTFKVTADEMLLTTGARAVGFTILCKERNGVSTALEKRLAISVDGRPIP